MRTTTGKFARRVAFGSALLLAAAGASAATITNTDGSFSPFGGFDWNPVGNVVTQGDIVNGGTVTSVFWANAVHIEQPGGAVFVTPGLDPPGSSYEYTAYATITETVTCAGNPGDPCGNSATFTATGGSWTVYYDTSPNANLVTGAGITDGTPIIAGNVDAGGGTFFLFGTGGIGGFNYQGQVTFTDNTYVNPSLLGSTASATLQFGSSTTLGWTPPTSQPGTNGGTTGLPTPSLAFQADGNQSFTVAPVPEPGTLALMAAAILGIGFVRRRSK